MRGKAGPACQGLEWQEGGGPYPCASRTPRMTQSGTETSPPASGDTAPGGRRPGLGRRGRCLGRAAAGCRGGPASSLSPQAGSDLQAPELLFGPASLCLPWVQGPGHPLPGTADPGAPWSPCCHSKVRTTMSPHSDSYDRGAVEMILGEKIKSSMLYINTFYI